MRPGLTRRAVLKAGLSGAALAAAAPLDFGSVLDRALAAAPAGCGQLKDIEHIVVFVQENRSFDSYFGTYKGVRGFGDPKGGAFAQPGYAAPGFGGKLYPFHLDTKNNG